MLDPRIVAYEKQQPRGEPLGVGCTLAKLDDGRYFVQPKAGFETEKTFADGGYFGKADFKVSKQTRRDVIVAQRRKDEDKKERISIGPVLQYLMLHDALWEFPGCVYDDGSGSGSTTYGDLTFDKWYASKFLPDNGGFDPIYGGSYVLIGNTMSQCRVGSEIFTLSNFYLSAIYSHVLSYLNTQNVGEPSYAFGVGHKTLTFDVYSGTCPVDTSGTYGDPSYLESAMIGLWVFEETISVSIRLSSAPLLTESHEVGVNLDSSDAFWGPITAGFNPAAVGLSWTADITGTDLNVWKLENFVLS